MHKDVLGFLRPGSFSGRAELRGARNNESQAAQNSTPHRKVSKQPQALTHCSSLLLSDDFTSPVWLKRGESPMTACEEESSWEEESSCPST